MEGQLQTRKWSGNDGQERYSTEVVLNRFRGELTMLDSRGGAPGAQDSGPAGLEQDNTRNLSDSTISEDLDDEIPF